MATLAHLQRDFRRRFSTAGAGFGGRVTSYIRSVEHNRRVGGHPRSQHLYGLAADIVPLVSERSSLKRAMRAQGLVVIDEGDHVHVQLLRAGQLEHLIDV